MSDPSGAVARVSLDRTVGELYAIAEENTALQSVARIMQVWGVA